MSRGNTQKKIVGKEAPVSEERLSSGGEIPGTADAYAPLHAALSTPQSFAELLAQRPNLTAWLSEYESIQAEYAAALRAHGIDLDEKGRAQEEAAALRARLQEKGACFRNGGASIVTGALSDACVACTGGRGSKTFTLSTACNRHCYFCFNANQADYDTSRVLKTDWQEELDAFLAKGNVTHVALTGGEPLLHPREVVAFFQRAHQAFPQAHLRLYTDGDLLSRDLLAQLRAAGLQELRLSVKLDVLDSPEQQDAAIDEALARITQAKCFIRDVMVEMPAIPGTEQAMRKLLLGLDAAGAFGINLLEFGYPMNDWAEFARRGFTVANPPFPVAYDYEYAAGLPVAGSEALCLRLLEFAVDQWLSLGVHYCSLENKHRDQILQQNRQAKLDARTWELDAQDFFYKTIKVFDADVALVKQCLDQQGYPYEQDFEEGSLSFAPRHVQHVAQVPAVFARSYNVVEQKGKSLVIREVELELVENAGLAQSVALQATEGNDMDIWSLKASACELLAFSLRYPTADVAGAIASGEWAAAAQEIAAALGVTLPADFAAELVGGVAASDGDVPVCSGERSAETQENAQVDALLPALRADATRLFVGSPEPAVSPFEGVWRAADDGVDPLLFVNPHSMEVERFCHACGLGRPQGTNEPLDFAPTELELLQYLASLEAGLMEPAEGAPATADLPGGSAAAAYGRFLAEHVSTWLPNFAEKLCEQAHHPFYRAAGQLLRAYLPAL